MFLDLFEISIMQGASSVLELMPDLATKPYPIAPIEAVRLAV